MWVDTCAEAHTGEAFSSFTWRDYAAKHTVTDFALRWGHGFLETFSLPFRNERIFGIRFPLLYLLAAAGVAISVFTRNRTYLTLTVFSTPNASPHLDHPSNPTDRVPSRIPLSIRARFCGLRSGFSPPACGSKRTGRDALFFRSRDSTQLMIGFLKNLTGRIVLPGNSLLILLVALVCSGAVNFVPNGLGWVLRVSGIVLLGCFCEVGNFDIGCLMDWLVRSPLAWYREALPDRQPPHHLAQTNRKPAGCGRHPSGMCAFRAVPP